MSDTIFALASARGKAGVAVIRVSGPGAFDIAETLAGCRPEPGRFRLRSFRDAAGSVIDSGLLLGFGHGASFTGEESVEFQLHGSIATVRAMLDRLAELGLRSAEPGEFTRRALQNGRMDLTQVEGLADLIDAETDAQRRLALKVSTGAARDLVLRWRKDLLRASALIEATIDFAEEDVPVDVTGEVRGLIDGVVVELRSQIANLSVAERIREGFEVAIVGEPNVGKSTLLNRLAGREAALTSERAGTTRDVIEVRMDLDGLAVTWLDTAGFRDTADEIEAMGIERARARAEGADLRVFLVESGQKPPFTPGSQDIVVVAKSDLHHVDGVSGKTGAGLDMLARRVAEILGGRTTGSEVMSRERHRQSLISAERALSEATTRLASGMEEAELVAEGLRDANHDLALLIGLVDVEQVLGEIFSSFCIGK